MYEINLIKARTVTRHRRRLRRVVLLGYFAVVYVVTLMIVQAGASVNRQIETAQVELDASSDRRAELQPAVDAMMARETSLETEWNRVRLKQVDLEHAPRVAPITEFLGHWFDRDAWRRNAAVESVVYRDARALDPVGFDTDVPAIEPGVIVARGWLRTPDVDTRARAMLADLEAAYGGERAPAADAVSGAITEDERETFATLRELSRLPVMIAVLVSQSDTRTFQFALVFARDLATAQLVADQEGQP